MTSSDLTTVLLDNCFVLSHKRLGPMHVHPRLSKINNSADFDIEDVQKLTLMGWKEARGGKQQAVRRKKCTFSLVSLLRFPSSGGGHEMVARLAGSRGRPGRVGRLGWQGQPGRLGRPAASLPLSASGGNYWPAWPAGKAGLAFQNSNNRKSQKTQDGREAAMSYL